MDEHDVAVLRRILTEASFAILQRQLMEEFKSRKPIWKSKEWVLLNALQDAAVIRTARLLDRSKHKDSRSFLYVRAKFAEKVEAFACDRLIDLSRLEKFTRNINTLRDLTIAHITTKSVDNSEKLYVDNPVPFSDWDNWLQFIWDCSSDLYPDIKTEPKRVAPPKFEPESRSIFEL